MCIRGLLKDMENPVIDVVNFSIGSVFRKNVVLDVIFPLFNSLFLYITD